MTVRELIDRLFERIQCGDLKGSDPVSADLFGDEHEREDVAGYLARKYNIVGEADGDNKGTAECISEQKG